MRGWFTKARESLSTIEGPQPFEIRCQCGNLVTGERLPKPQKLVCMSCGLAVFVLPANPYPPVVAAKIKAVAKKPFISSPVPPEIVAATEEDYAHSSTAGPGNDEADFATDDPREVARASKPGKRPAGAVNRPETGWAELPDRESVGERLSKRVTQLRVTLASLIRRQLTPLRLLAVGIVCLVSFTSLWLWHSAAVESARTTVTADIEDGLKAFRERNFTVAETKLAAAVDALALLGRTDNVARKVRQSKREAVAASGLSLRSARDLFAELKAGNGSRGTAANLKPHSAWMIIDAQLVAAPSTEGVLTDPKTKRVSPNPFGRMKVYGTGYPTRADERPIELRVAFAGLEKLLSTAEDDGGRVIFAARPLDLVPGDEGSRSVLRLDPQTAFLWADYDHFEAVGFSPIEIEDEQAAKAVLARQCQAIGLADQQTD